VKKTENMFYAKLAFVRCNDMYHIL